MKVVFIEIEKQKILQYSIEQDKRDIEDSYRKAMINISHKKRIKNDSQ